MSSGQYNITFAKYLPAKVRESLARADEDGIRVFPADGNLEDSVDIWTYSRRAAWHRLVGIVSDVLFFGRALLFGDAVECNFNKYAHGDVVEDLCKWGIRRYGSDQRKLAKT
jgi:hypothetical protein